MNSGIESPDCIVTMVDIHLRRHLWMWSDYRKYLPGQVIRIRLKIEKNCRVFFFFASAMIWPWLLHPGSRWMPNVLISSEIGSEWRTILGHSQLIECNGIYVLSLAHGSKLRGSDVICILQKKLSGKFSLNGARVCALGWPCSDFSLDFFF